MSKISRSLTTKVNKLLKGVEHKYYDTNAAVAVAAGTAAIVQLSGIVQGDDVNQRDGRRVNIESVVMSVFSSAVGSGAAAVGIPDALCRIIVFRQKVCDAAPTAGQILKSGTDIQSPYNLEQISKFEILYDKHPGETRRAYEATGLPNGFGLGTLSGGGGMFERFYKKVNKPAEWTGVNATDYSSGHIYALFLTSSSLALTTPQFTHYTRVRFTDS